MTRHNMTRNDTKPYDTVRDDTTKKKKDLQTLRTSNDGIELLSPDTADAKNSLSLVKNKITATILLPLLLSLLSLPPPPLLLLL